MEAQEVTLAIRLRPDLKAKLQEMASRERRSLRQQVTVMLETALRADNAAAG